MAVSFSRPDPTSPASVAEAAFPTVRRGYAPDDVRALLQSVAAELGRLQERERFLERELRTSAGDAASGPVELDDEMVTRLLGEETLRVLQTARESASQIKIKAEEGAARILREATEEAARLRRDAEVEAARQRSDAIVDAEAELSLAKQQGREMVNEARAYRERVLGELARRREAARQQIEQLVHGRDRLLQVFERARLVAVDVVSELEPLGEPDEYVDLSPTTGPVPMMVPSAALPRQVAAMVTPSDTESDESYEVDGVDEADGIEAEGTADVDTADVDTADVDTADVAPEVTVDVADDVGPEVDGADGEPDLVLAPETPDEATNVVELFPPAAADSDLSDASHRPAVDDLFARLRAETTPVVEGSAVEEPVVEEPVVDRSDVDVIADAEETIFERRDAALVPLIVASARKLKRVLADEQNDVLDAIRNAKHDVELTDLLPDVDPHVDRYVDAIAEELARAHEAGADGAARDLHLDPIRELVGRGLVAPLRDRLERSVVDGRGAADDTAKGVRAVYREWKTQHIDDQLDDVLRLAHGLGVLAGAGAGTPMCWAVDPAGPACPDAEDNSLAGLVPAGDAYPTGHRVAPAHSGCRCLLARPAE